MPGMNEGYSTVSTISHKAKSGAGKQTQFEQVVLLLQGGGALGSYQAGVYQALAEAELHPDWVAGISIGAINSALIKWSSSGGLRVFANGIDRTDDATSQATTQ